MRCAASCAWVAGVLPPTLQAAPASCCPLAAPWADSLQQS